MADIRTWLASAALVGGAGGGGALGIAAASGPAAPDASGLQSAPAVPATGVLQREISGLLADDHDLKRALAAARDRLGAQVHASEHTLAVLHGRLLAAETELARIQAARANAQGAPAPAATVAAVPATHSTTGASGAGTAAGGEPGSDGGGSDD